MPPNPAQGNHDSQTKKWELPELSNMRKSLRVFSGCALSVSCHRTLSMKFPSHPPQVPPDRTSRSRSPVHAPLRVLACRKLVTESVADLRDSAQRITHIRTEHYSQFARHRRCDHQTVTVVGKQQGHDPTRQRSTLTGTINRHYPPDSCASTYTRKSRSYAAPIKPPRREKEIS